MEGITDNYLQQFIFLFPAFQTLKRKAQLSDSNSTSRNLTGRKKLKVLKLPYLAEH
jgi:hypothetical protein